LPVVGFDHSRHAGLESVTRLLKNDVMSFPHRRTRTRRYRGPFRLPVAFSACRSWAGCTTIMFGFDLRQAQRLKSSRGQIPATSGGKKIRSKRAMGEIGSDGGCGKYGQANQPRQEYSRQYDVGQRQADGHSGRWRNGIEGPLKKRKVSWWPFALRKRWRAFACDDLSRGGAAGKFDHIPRWATIPSLSAFRCHGAPSRILRDGSTLHQMSGSRTGIGSSPPQRDTPSHGG
jgi:hypothetical protein